MGDYQSREADQEAAAGEPGPGRRGRRCRSAAGQGKLRLAGFGGAKYPGKSLLAAEMTIRKGEVVWDLNGRAAQDWKSFPYRRRSVPQ